MKNELERALSAAKERVQYDAQVKKVLASKQILAWILRRTVDGFAGMEIRDIIPCIEGEPEISLVPVNPGETNRKRKEPEQISGSGCEDKVPDEGAVYYDIRFYVLCYGYKDYRKMEGIITKIIFV